MTFSTSATSAHRPENYGHKKDDHKDMMDKFPMEVFSKKYSKKYSNKFPNEFVNEISKEILEEISK